MVAKAKAPTAKAPSLGAAIDQLWAAREEKRRLEAQAKKIEEQISAFQDALFERLDAEGLDKATGARASVSISEAVTADVQDWDAAWADISRKKLFHLVQRRLNDAAYRELLESGKKLAGTLPFTKRKLNLRSL